MLLSDPHHQEFICSLSGLWNIIVVVPCHSIFFSWAFPGWRALQNVVKKRRGRVAFKKITNKAMKRKKKTDLFTFWYPARSYINMIWNEENNLSILCLLTQATKPPGLGRGECGTKTCQSLKVYRQAHVDKGIMEHFSFFFSILSRRR